MAQRRDYDGIGIETFYEQPRGNSIVAGAVNWYEPFTQVTFYNFNPTDTVYINNFPVLPNTFHHVSLRVGQYNTTSYKIDYRGSDNPNLWAVFSIERQNIMD